MLRNEARAVAALLDAWPDDAFPVGYLASGLVDDDRGDVGHTAVLDVVRRRGLVVRTHELRPAHGVDVAGDLLDPRTWAALRAAGCRSFLAANLLEHLADRAAFVERVQRELPVGGRLLVTVPGRYPYHPDPIDTMYRPSPDELVLEFPELVAERALSVSEAPAVTRLAREPAALGHKILKAVRARRTGTPTSQPTNQPVGPPAAGPGRLEDLTSGLLPARVSIASFVRPGA